MKVAALVAWRSILPALAVCSRIQRQEQALLSSLCVHLGDRLWQDINITTSTRRQYRPEFAHHSQIKSHQNLLRCLRGRPSGFEAQPSFIRGLAHPCQTKRRFNFNSFGVFSSKRLVGALLSLFVDSRRWSVAWGRRIYALSRHLLPGRTQAAS